MGRDVNMIRIINGSDVSIHAPHVGRDAVGALVYWDDTAFQSTRPTWGATFTGQRKACVKCCFNPRAPRGARHGKGVPHSHAAAFQSTRPTWGATSTTTDSPQARIVSIHAPHVGRDSVPSAFASNAQFQSTRPTWGATL